MAPQSEDASGLGRPALAGVIGAARADEATLALAEQVGRLLAEAGCTVVCGGLGGVMEAAARGARLAGGDVIGILPGPSTADANPYVTHPVATNMGHARNVILVHTADFLVAVGGEAGTLSEVALGLKTGKPVLSLRSWDIPGVQRLEGLEDLSAWLARRGR